MRDDIEKINKNACVCLHSGARVFCVFRSSAVPGKPDIMNDLSPERRWGLFRTLAGDIENLGAEVRSRLGV